MEQRNTGAAPRTERPENDPRDGDPQTAESLDPHSGMSDDPRVDPTPDRRHSEKS